MTIDVLCLRPLADFERVGATPPASLQVAYRGPADADVPELMKQARAMIVPAVGPKLPASLFQNGSTVRFVQITGAGLDRLDADALKQEGVAVSNVPGGSNSALAEYSLTTASVLLRRFAWADSEIRKGNYAAFRARMAADNLRGIDGLLVGIVGFGTIGRAVAEAFRGRNARICYYDPMPANPEAAKALDAQALSLEDLLKTSDVVSLHLPLLPATRGIIGARELAAMKPGAILIQASRGGIVDEAALAAALQSGHLGGAAVDVYSAEPPAADHPLFALEGEAANRILFTPHIAGVTRQSAAFLMRSAWQNIERVLIAKEPPLNRVY
jgi:phosphoglycerate dehydrogenase-like enzyme